MTTANKITVLRILLVPFFVVEMLYYDSSGNEWHRFWGILAFAVAAICDGVDGYIARRYNQHTELGALLDPVADKLLLVSALVLLAYGGGAHLPDVPRWLLAVVVSRDVLLTVGFGVAHYCGGRVQVRPRLMGKVATVLQMTVIFWAFLKWDDAWLWRWSLLAAGCTAISGVLYLGDWMRFMSASPASAAPADKRDDLK